MAQAITFDETASLYLNTIPIPRPEKPTSVVIELLAAPINPIDQLVLRDAYPVKPQTFISSLPVPGYDGAARVLATGAEVTNLHAGNLVITRRHGLGTWRTHASVDASDLMHVNSALDPDLASILRMGVLPAYYLLDDNSSHLRVGDWIVHTAATGVIAHFVTQLAKLRGWKVLAVIRNAAGDSSADADSFDSVARGLRAHGADAVVSEADLSKGRSSAPFADKRIMLALDAVGGKVAEALVGVCSPESTFVTYGFLAGTPSTPMALTPAMTWGNGMTFKGFRLSKSSAARGQIEEQDLLDWLGAMFLTGKLTPPRLERVIWYRNSGDALEKVKDVLARDADKQKFRKCKSIIMFEG